MTRVRTAVVVVTLALVAVAPADGNPASETLRARASNELYSLDDQQSLATWRQATAADPQDAAAWRGLASGILARIGMLRGTMTVDSYLGRVATKDVALPPPPADLAKEFDTAITKAIELSRRNIAARPKDVQALYELGAAVGMRASYIATVDGGTLAAFRSAREAYDTCEKVLDLDPSRADAGLVVGTYRYLVSVMSMPMRWIAYVAGFGGGRERGVRLVENAANYRGDSQSDARLALVLIYTREGRFDDALAQLKLLHDRYPRNRLLLLETGSTLIRARRYAEADRILSDGIASLSTDGRPRMFGEDALWYYRRGAARAALGRTAEAQADLNRSLRANGRKWVQGRAHLELGRLALQQSDVAAARQHLQLAVTLGENDRDGASADRARELMKQGTQPR